MTNFAKIHKSTIINTLNCDITSFREDNHNTDVEMILRIEYNRYIRNKLLYDCLSDCVDELNPELREKLEGIIIDTKLKQYLKLDNKRLLCLTLNNEELSYQEGEEVKTVLQKKIWDKRTKTNDEFKSITSKDLSQVVPSKSTIAISDVSLSAKDQSILAGKEKLVKIQELFMRNVIIRNKLFQDMLELRLNEVPEKCNQFNHYCKLMIECNYLKSKIAEFKMKTDIFLEIPKAIEAYHELLKDIKKQQDDCELSIEKMKDLKKKYESVSGREYDEILKSYLMYKSSLNKLNKMYKLVK